MQISFRFSKVPGLEICAFRGVTEPVHFTLYQEASSSGGPGLYKLSRAEIAVVMNRTV